MSALLAALQLMVATPDPAATAPSVAQVIAADAPAPPAFLNFCVTYPAECGQATSQDAQARLSATPVLSPYWQTVFAQPSGSLTPWLRRAWVRESRELNRLEEDAIRTEAAQARVAAADQLDLLKTVNADVNARIIPRTDREVFGDLDHWALPLDTSGAPFGDCEDFALQKRSLLRKAGLPLQVMSVAMVETSRRETHAVLLVSTVQGVLVLDNLTSRIRRLEQTPYRIISREMLGAPLHWKASVQPKAAG